MKNRLHTQNWSYANVWMGLPILWCVELYHEAWGKAVKADEDKTQLRNKRKKTRSNWNSKSFEIWAA